MPRDKHGVDIPGAKWREIKRLLKLLPFIANTPSAFVIRAVENEIERVWETFRERLAPLLRAEDADVLGLRGRE